MTMYAKQIEQLIRLQELDEKINALQGEIAAAPKELTELEQKLTETRAAREQLAERVEMQTTQHKRLSTEIEDDAAKIKKSKNKLMMASNTREYHAMMREMDNLEKMNRMREEENMGLAEEIARQNETLATMDTDIATIQQTIADKNQGLEQRLGDAQSGLDALHKSRAASGKQVPPPILSRYEFIRARLKNPVIVSVTSGICAGCNIAIPPQTYNELQRGQQIHSCPNCQRLIFWNKHVKGEGEEG